jgi:hypothetical protein
VMTESLARVHVAQVHFDERDPGLKMMKATCVVGAS